MPLLTREQPRHPTSGQFLNLEQPSDSQVASDAATTADAEPAHGIKVGDRVLNIFGDSGTVKGVTGDILQVANDKQPEALENWHASHTSVKRENDTMSVEIRSIPELRAGESQGDEMSLVGYAAMFNSQSKDLGGFRETIMPGAFTRALRENQDVKCLFNHDANRILGRTTSGTLTLEQDDKGLRFRCMLDPAQQSHRDLYASVKRGDVNECSFAFSVDDAGQNWSDATDEKGKWYASRKLTDVNLYDVSAVVHPAYNTTSVAARNQVSAEVRSIVLDLVKKHAATQGEKRGGDDSIEQVLNDISKALSEKFPAPADNNCCGPYCGQYWICETHADYIIACDQVTGDYCSIPYAEVGDDNYQFGSPVPVEKEWVPSERTKARAEEFRAVKAKHIQDMADQHAYAAADHQAAADHHTDQADAHTKAAEALQKEADARAMCERCMGNCRMETCSCQNQMVDARDVWDDQDDDGESDEFRQTRKAAKFEARADGKVRTKSVGGKNLPKSAFAFVGDPDKTETWKLPIHDADHVRNALARFGQTEDIPADKKPGVLRKIKAAAKKFGIEVSEDDAARMLDGIPMDAEEVESMKLAFEVAIRK